MRDITLINDRPFNVISNNTLLRSNKNYLGVTDNLICTLPSNPDIGDNISLSAGNYPFKIKHGNENQIILNNNTFTIAGIENGIVLKAYADISIVFLGDNVWKTFSRNRVVNNFTPLSIEEVSVLKTYTATTNDIVGAYSSTFANMYNGIKTPTGAYGSDGFLSNNGYGHILLTFTEPIILDYLKLWNGQGNITLGSASGYWTTNMTVYSGVNVDGEVLGNLTFTNETGILQQRSLVANTSPNTNFFLFVSSTNTIGIMELEFYGKTASGGEVAV